MTDFMPVNVDNPCGEFLKWRDDGKPKVLLIEDRPGHRVMIGNELRDLGYDVAECGSLKAVQNFVSVLATPPIGILLDLSIPLGSRTDDKLENGRDCGLYLRRQPVTEKVPIVAYTAYPEDDRLPGWSDIIGFSAILKKNADSVAKIDETVRHYFH